MKENAIVTGSTSGIGLTVARALAQAGFGIAINGFSNNQEISVLLSQLSTEYNVDVIYENADMRDSAAIKAMIDNVNTKLGSVDILVNNAGIQYVSPIETFPDEKWNDIITVNLSAAFHTIKNAVPLMREKKWGRIINIASAHGLVGSANKTAYVAAKHGLLGLTKSVALELANSGITCNAICPGFVYTPLVKKQIEDNAQKNNISIEQAEEELLIEKHPVKKFVLPEEIGKTVLYLCDMPSITGSSITIDCGWTAQ